MDCFLFKAERLPKYTSVPAFVVFVCDRWVCGGVVVRLLFRLRSGCSWVGCTWLVTLVVVLVGWMNGWLIGVQLADLFVGQLSAS